MKITKELLSEIINEEIDLMIENGELDEGFLDRLKARGAGVGSRIGSAARGAVQTGLGGVAGFAGLDDVSTQLKDKAAATKASAQDRAKANQTLSILNSHLVNLTNDLEKLGIDLETSGVKGALSSLRRALAGSIKRRAKE